MDEDIIRPEEEPVSEEPTEDGKSGKEEGGETPKGEKADPGAEAEG